MTNNTLNLLDAIIIETAPQPTASVIWLHGLGASGDDFAGILPDLKLNAEPGIRFIFPHAPNIPITVNQNMVMPGWYDIVDAGFKRNEDEAGIRQSAAQIDQLIEAEIAAGIASQRIILAGFSQGGAIALHCGLRFRESLGGIIALSTYLPLAHTLATERHQTNLDVPILMMHGDSDTVIPIAMAEFSRQQLTPTHKVHWQIYPMEHNVCAQQITDIGHWLKEQLSL